MYVTPGLGGGGGAERSLASLVSHWRGRIDLEVVTFSDRAELACDIIDGGARVTNLDGHSMHAVIGQLRRLIKERRPDLVHSVLFDADVATRLATPAGIPVSCSLVNVNYGPQQWEAPGRSRWKVTAVQAIDAISAQRVARFHALSSEVASVMAKRLHISRDDIDIIPRGRSRQDVGYPSQGRRLEARSRLGVIGPEPLLVAAARHEWQKGLDVLLHAVPYVRETFPNLIVRIGGRDGAETSRLHELAEAVGLEPDTVFIGPRKDVPDLMCAADVYCVPSRWEGLGSIMIEAMALGAPVVAADIAPIRELDPSGRWIRHFQPGSLEDLAYTIKETLSGQDKDERSAAAIQLFENSYRSDHIADQMATFFHRAVN